MITHKATSPKQDPILPDKTGKLPRVPEQAVAGQPVAKWDPLVPTLFHQSWWLEAATGHRYEVAEISQGGRVMGRLPYVVRKRSIYSELRLPPLTYFLGPAVSEGEGSENNRFLKRLDITRELLRKLPSTWSSYIKCHAGVPDAIAFQEESYRTYAQFTHVIEAAPTDQLWKKMRNKTRNVIRRAEEELTVEELSDADQFCRLYDRNLESRGLKSDLDHSVSTAVVSAALERGQGRVLVARSKTGEILAGNFCAWDEKVCYYIMCTRDEVSGNGANSMLLWEAIKHATQKDLVFDLAGLGNRGTVLFYTGFGGTVQPRYVAVKTTRKARLAQEIRNLLVPENFYY